MRGVPRRKRHPWAGLVGGVLLAATGLLLVAPLPLGRPLARLSYDCPFWFHRGPAATNVVLVYADEGDLERYGNGKGTIDRAVQNRLLQRLVAGGARLVFYDFVFHATNGLSQVDGEFAQTMLRQRKLVLGANHAERWQGNAMITELLLPAPRLRSAAKWGLLDIDYDEDTVIRKLPEGDRRWPSAAWVAAELLGAPVAQGPHERHTARWLNYYGPPRTRIFAECSFENALEPGFLAPGFFANRIVVVGTRSDLGTIGQKVDQFPTPYTRVGGGLAPGAEIQATALLNLVQGDWLRRMGGGLQAWIVGILGLAFGIGLTALRPWHGAWAAVCGAMAIALTSFYLQWYQHLWWTWMVPAGVQIPAGLAWATGAQYVLETRKRLRLRKALAGYLSPESADQIAEGDVAVTLGGREIEATVMFTDIRGFTSISEGMKPDHVFDLLNQYFNRTSMTILQERGTIIKYIGDSVMAVWGAPLEDANQAEHALIAAWGMVQAGRQQIAGHNLQTRVGINSGPVKAGNMGSEVRFDYTVIGDTVNFASRLEGMNKHLKTEILISRSTRDRLSQAKFRIRCLGRFQIPGKFEPVELHEVLGLTADFVDEGLWLNEFDQGVRLFSQQRLPEAERRFRHVIHLRGGNDGPSEFYLEQLAAIQKGQPLDGTWDGVVKIAAK